MPGAPQSLAITLLAYYLVMRAGVNSPTRKCGATIVPEEPRTVGTRQKVECEMGNAARHKKRPVGSWQQKHDCYLLAVTCQISGGTPRLYPGNNSLVRISSGKSKKRILFFYVRSGNVYENKDNSDKLPVEE
jgi:hypothetical protein